MKPVRYLWIIAFTFLVMSGAIGLFMRLQFFQPANGVNYQFLVHTHSHVVLLGWVFNAIIAGIHLMLFRNSISKRQIVLYLLFQITILGMLGSFPFQGYATVSILFSTTHILLSYMWVAWIWRKTNELEQKAGGFIRWGLFYLLISTIGPFSLGPIIASGGSGSDLYFMAIYFYLHFLYNGFFIFTLFGMLFWLVAKKNLALETTRTNQFLKLMNISCILTLFLSVLWMKPHYSIYILGGVSGIVQILAVLLLVGIFRSQWTLFLRQISKQSRILVSIALMGFGLKVILQLLSAIPSIADLAYNVRNYIIGYLHLVFLGIVTPFLVAWFNANDIMSLKSVTSRFGLIFYLAGFILSEILIITPSGWNGYYFEALFSVSGILLLGLVFMYPRRALLTD